MMARACARPQPVVYPHVPAGAGAPYQLRTRPVSRCTNWLSG